ncbi:hypothetical protein ACVW0B_001549 [Thermostichus sp. MS-CIW-23]|jgi:hypothetical protein
MGVGLQSKSTPPSNNCAQPGNRWPKLGKVVLFWMCPRRLSLLCRMTFLPYPPHLPVLRL